MIARTPFRTTLVALLIAFSFQISGAADFRLPPPEKIKLPNGLTIYYLRTTDVPLASLRIAIKGAGTAFEPQTLEGTANMAADLLLKGTPSMTADQIAEKLDSMGAELNVGASEEFVSISGNSLAEHFPRLMEIAAEVLAKATFPEDEFKKEQVRRIDEVKSLKDNPASAVRPYFQHAYFGLHPMGNPALGTEASLGKMTVADIKKYYASRYRPDRAVVSIVGDIGKENLPALLDKTLGIWTKPAGQEASLEIPPLPVPEGIKLVLIDKPDATQTYFILGAPGYRLGDPATPQASVMNTLWGGRFTSWFNTELRIKRGLTYGANSRFQNWAGGGLFTASSYTQNSTIGQMLDITFDLLRKAAQTGFTTEEVESARNYILGQFPPTLETNESKAAAYVRLAFYGLGFDYYDRYLANITNVSNTTVNEAAKQLLPAAKYVLVLVGKASEIRPQLKKYGNWVEKNISNPGF